MKVLLVEDEEFIRDLFKRQLDLSGFTTDAFSTGNDGIAALDKNAYDLVLLDIMLPDINGLQILQTIRSKPETKNVAVVLLTNLGQDAVIKQGFELGADGYLVKAAYTPDQIVQEVKNIMQKKQNQSQPQASDQAGISQSGQVTAPVNINPVQDPNNQTTTGDQETGKVSGPTSAVNLEPSSGAMMNPSFASTQAVPGLNSSEPQINTPSSQEVVLDAANPQQSTPPGIAVVEK